MKRMMTSLVLALSLIVGQAAAWSPVDFAGGSPSGIVAEETGSYLVTDVFNKVIWRVTDSGVEKAAGQISVAGLDGAPIGKYEDGTLHTALFMEPWAIAPFLNGWAVTDTGANVVRYVSDDAVLTAVGSGEAGSADGRGTAASFHTPTGLAAGDDGVLYIADTGNNAIRVLDTEGNVTTLNVDVLEPTGLCWADGALYVADTGHNRICRVKDGVMEVVAGVTGEEAEGYYFGGYRDGSVMLASFDHPQGVTVDENGVIYVADTGNHAVRKIENGRVTTLAVTREETQGPMKPRSILVCGDTLLVTDVFAQNVIEVPLTTVSYTDVEENAWYAPYVMAATQRGITEGTGNGCFAPDTAVTRAMFATMIARLHLSSDGWAVIEGDTSFPDLVLNSWYDSEVRWAADQGIILGMDGLFMPNLDITREQLVTMLYRYTVAYGYEAVCSGDLSAFTDGDKVSPYAQDAVKWAVDCGILSGHGDGTLDPQGTATRAQTAKLIVGAMDQMGL